MRESEVMKKYFIIGTLALINFFGIGRVDGQQWEGIVPLVSKCEDVKKTFSLTKCDLPVTRVELPSKKIVIDFSTTEDEWPVSNDTVVNVLVIFHELPKLFDYTTEFTDYTITHESDVPAILIYKNDKKGVRLTVQTGRGLYIDSLILYPSQQNIRTLKNASRRK